MTIAKIRTFILRYNLLKFLFFGNYFYALCAVVLSIDTLLTLELYTADGHYILILFLGVIVFYTHAYRTLDKVDEGSVYLNAFYQQRTLWYIRNNRLVRVQQFLFAAVVIIASLYYYLPIFGSGIITDAEYMVICAIAILAGAYVGYGSYNIRRYGLFKPFIIAMLWTGMVTLLPVFTAQWKVGQHFVSKSSLIILCLYNTIYIAQLCVLFDIKDYAVDARRHLRTFIVCLGLKRTLRYVMVPMYIVSLLLWALFAEGMGYNLTQGLLGFVPLLALAAVVYMVRKPRPLLFYLFIVDGLMLLKGIIGVIIGIIGF